MKSILLTTVSILFSIAALAHSGNTDSAGCHHDRINGGYHCHKSEDKSRKVDSEETTQPNNGITKKLTDSEIKQVLILQSIKSYSGNCPCPEFRDRAGRRCGKRSAYNRPGGASPLCYESDVTPQMIETYKKSYE